MKTDRRTRHCGSRGPGWAVAIGALILCGLLPGCANEVPVSTTELVALPVGELPTSHEDELWERAPRFRTELILQDLVEPRQLEVTTDTVEVRALTDGERLALRLSWRDDTRDDLPGASRFSDACAVQFPQTPSADVPAPQMGQTGGAVEITYWRASWQATVDGRGTEIADLYPGATVDHYPFRAAPLVPGSPEQLELAAQYAPAVALGNAMEGPRTSPVQDLLAEGPGTLTAVEAGSSTGTGERVEEGWQVMLVRPLPRGLVEGRRTQIAFAVWDGSHQEVGARKMRSIWMPLHWPEETGEGRGE